MSQFVTTLAELNKRLNPVITEREMNGSAYMKDEVYTALLDIVRKEAHQYVEATNQSI